MMEIGRGRETKVGLDYIQQDVRNVQGFQDIRVAQTAVASESDCLSKESVGRMESQLRLRIGRLMALLHQERTYSKFTLCNLTSHVSLQNRNN